ncbi:MAG: hypothetical protein IJC88_04930 [Oscillospiraceae bacterium]|nr:hypothetical protein [Oscillospiraceae bacterium]
MSITMSPADVVNAGMAKCYVNVGGRRYLMMMARDFEAKFKKKTAAVPILGRRMTGHKSTGAEGIFSMTIYKVTDLFDEMCQAYQESGDEITFDIMVTVSDPQSSAGTSSKIFHDCVLSGEVGLAALSAENKWLEQTVEGYFDNFEIYQKFADPKEM